MTAYTLAPTPVHDAPLAGPSVWTAATFPDARVWIESLDAATLDQLDRSAATGRFEAPAFAPVAARLRQELEHGRGFALLRGLDVDRYPEEQLCDLYWNLGAMLGQPLPQNVKGERLYAVRDEGVLLAEQYGQVGARFSKTSEAVVYHTDSAPRLLGNTPSVIGLFALEVAKSGGHSSLVSAGAVHNILREENPAALARLYQPFHFDRRMEWREGEPRTFLAPVFRYAARLEVRYLRHYIPSGHELAGDPLAPEDVAALDAFDAAMARPGLALHFEMRRGDFQLASNTAILHARTAFEDWPEPHRRRHLKRLWLRYTHGEEEP